MKVMQKIRNYYNDFDIVRESTALDENDVKTMKVMR